jgi:hypothetical protein
VSGDCDSGDATFEEAHARLSQGLKSCRSVVSTYRMLLTDPAAVGNDNEPFTTFEEFPDNDP